MKREFKTSKDFENWNDEMFKIYKDDRLALHPNPLVRYIENQRIKTILKFCKIKENEKVIEVGCGSGYILNFINNGELYGIDLSKTALEVCKNRLKNKNNIKEISLQNAEKTKYPDNYFDISYSSEVIEHVQNPKRMIDEMYRITKPKGRVVITFPNEKLINKYKKIIKKIGLYKLLLKDVPEHMEDEWHVTEFDYNLFKEIIKEKFYIKKSKGIPFFITPFRYATLLEKKEL